MAQLINCPNCHHFHLKNSKCFKAKTAKERRSDLKQFLEDLDRFQKASKKVKILVK